MKLDGTIIHGMDLDLNGRSGGSIDVHPYSGMHIEIVFNPIGHAVDLSDYYTKEQIDGKGYLTEHQDISGKQDVITDLASIRSGAAKGATALQSYTETDPTVPAWAKQSSKPTYTASEVGALPSSTVIPAAQIQSDWSQSDNTKLDYIKNKPTIDSCPIIEDARSQATDVNITATAPFASLANGQRIILHFKYANAASPTLQLTLSGGTTTSAYSLYQNYNNGVNALTLQAMPAGSYGEFVFDQTNSRWVLIGKDFNTTYSATYQADINNSAQGSRLIEPKLLRDNFYLKSETNSIAYIPDVDGHTTPPSSLDPNKLYDFGTVSSALTIPDFSASSGSLTGLVSNALNFYALRFVAGADNLSITFPTGVIVDDTPTINTGDYVEIMINLYVSGGTNYFYASIKVWQAP